jgi:hypothetical protein
MCWFYLTGESYSIFEQYARTKKRKIAQALLNYFKNNLALLGDLFMNNDVNVIGFIQDNQRL